MARILSGSSCLLLIFSTFTLLKPVFLTNVTTPELAGTEEHIADATGKPFSSKENEDGVTSGSLTPKNVTEYVLLTGNTTIPPPNATKVNVTVNSTVIPPDISTSKSSTSESSTNGLPINSNPITLSETIIITTPTGTTGEVEVLTINPITSPVNFSNSSSSENTTIHTPVSSSTESIISVHTTIIPSNTTPITPTYVSEPTSRVTNAPAPSATSQVSSRDETTTSNDTTSSSEIIGEESASGLSGRAVPATASGLLLVLVVRAVA